MSRSSYYGREGWTISPFFFYSPGQPTGQFVEGRAQPLHRSPDRIVYQVGSIEPIALLLAREEKNPGDLKRGLVWICPYPDPPCWHQVTDVGIKPVEYGVEVTLTLTPCSHHQEEKL